MKLWGSSAPRCALIAATFLACTESASETPGVGGGGAGRDAGVAGTGGAPDIGVIWTAGASGDGYVNLERCGSGTQSQAGASALTSPPERLGLDESDEVTREGRVSRLIADGMEIETTEGISTFVWSGPPLGTAFDVDDGVQIVADFADYGLSAPRISIVRSERATAVAVDGSASVGLSMEPGSTTTLRGFEPAFPKLVYGLVSCCASGDGSYYNSYYHCDYSALDATFDGSSTAIARGATGVVGPWSITNVRSSYGRLSEAAWGIQVTLLGPAQPMSPDGGL